MIDITDVTCGIYGTEYADKAGYMVDPKSDLKEVFIPSPPTKLLTKINPRQGIILIADPAIEEGYEKMDELKAYAKEKKVFVACVAENSIEALEATYNFMIKEAKKLNIKKDDIQVRYMNDLKEHADAFVEYAMDEMDIEIEDAEEFEF